MKNAIHTEEHGGLTLKIYHDQDTQNPREWSNVGKMVCSHRRYYLGDEQFNASDFYNWEEVAEWLKNEREAVILLPLILYDHSGLSMSTRRDYPFNCQWDAGQIGFIYCTQKQVDDEFSGDVEKAKNYLAAEVGCYDDYLRGNCFGYVIEDEEGDFVDSCWGYLGDYNCDGGVLSEGRAMIKYFLAEREEAQKFAEKFMCC